MTIPVEIQVALIAAVTSTIVTPLVQMGMDAFKRGREHKLKIAPIVEHVRILHRELLQQPINPDMQGILERIAIIEQFHDPVLSSTENHYIKQSFLDHAKRLNNRHKQTRPWMQIEYPEECQLFGNKTERFLAILRKEKNVPELYGPSE